MNKVFFIGVLIGCWGGFVFAVMVLDKFYKELMKRVIDEIHKGYKEGLNKKGGKI